MVSDYLTCPMCGFDFVRGDTLCSHGCPLGAMCHLVRCPNCAYEFPEVPQVVSWVRRVLRRRLPVTSSLPEGVVPVTEVKDGESARVVCLGPTATERHRTLCVFGLGPGAEITVLQQRPACVIRIEETELALDFEIAREILVSPAEAPVP